MIGVYKSPTITTQEYQAWIMKMRRQCDVPSRLRGGPTGATENTLKKKLKKPEPCGLQTAPVAGRTTTHHSDSICRPVSTTASHSLWAQSEAWEKALEKPP